VRIFRWDFALESTLDGIVFDEIGKVVGSDEIVDGDDFVPLFKEPLFDDGTEDKAADATEPVNGNIWHDVVLELPAAGERGKLIL